MARKTKQNDRSWKSIKQDVGKKPVTKIALKRKLFGGIHTTGLIMSALLIFALLVGGISYFNNNSFHLNLTGPSKEIGGIRFATDGVLNKNWLRNVISIKKGTTLMGLDIFELKAQLETDGQVKHAKVERVFPKTLKIQITEHRPVLKIAIKNKRGKNELLLISSSGNIYKGFGFSNTFLNTLPYLSTARLVKTKAGYKPIPEINEVSKLLEIAQDRYPKLYQNWKVVSYKNLNKASMNIGGIIKVKSSKSAEITFNNGNFENQMNKLTGIYHEAYKRGIKKLGKIDLSLNQSATLQVANRK